MLLLRFAVWMFSVGIMMLDANAVCSQDYPNKPIRIVTAEPGGGNDFVSRLVAQRLSGLLDQPVIVENRGGNSVIPAQIVSRALPDGYTLLVYSNGLWLLPLMQKVPYDPVEHFAPVSLINRAPNVLVVNPSVPASSVKELIALAKAKHGELNYASASTGGSPHLAAELFKAMAGVNIVRIAYKGSGPALNDLIGGRVQLMFGTAASVGPHVKSGRLRSLAVTSAEPSALLPELPTVAASGLPGYESIVIQGMFAPAGTPAKIIDRLSQEIAQVLNRADAKEKFLGSGVEPVGGSPEQLAAKIRADMTRMGRVIKDAGIKAD